MSDQSLEARVKQLEDKEEIRELMWNYTYWLDYGEQEKMLACFTEDARMEVRMRGGVEEGEDSFEIDCKGREEITYFYNIMVHQKDRFTASHFILNPVVSVDGDKGKGVFYLLEPTCIARAMWGHGRYDMEFTRVDGEWKISFFGFLWNFNTPYEDGWGKKRMALL